MLFEVVNVDSSTSYTLYTQMSDNLDITNQVRSVLLSIPVCLQYMYSLSNYSVY